MLFSLNVHLLIASGMPLVRFLILALISNEVEAVSEFRAFRKNWKENLDYGDNPMSSAN